MKILDRYILSTFFVPLIYCLLAFSMIFIIADLFNNFPDFQKAQTPLRMVLLFYAMLLPSIIIYLAPVSLLMAVLYSLSQLTRHNEITAMRAGGISLNRIMLPLFTVGVLASLIVGAINETLGPWSAHWSAQFIRLQQKSNNHEVVSIVRNQAFRNEKGHRIWVIGRFDKRTSEMENVTVTQLRPDNTTAAMIRASRAMWADSRWLFKEIEIQLHDKDGDRMGRPRIEAWKEMTTFDETPADFLRMIKIEEPKYVSALDIWRHIRNHPRLSGKEVRKRLVDFHARLAMPWTCLIFILLGVPMGAHTGRKGAMRGIMLAIGLFFFYYFMMQYFLIIGKQEWFHLPPWVAGWTPNMVMTGIAGFIISKMR